MVRKAPLVRNFPLLAQLANGFLHLAPRQRRNTCSRLLCFGHGRIHHQGLSALHQCLAQLVCRPARPPRSLTRGQECCMHTRIKRVIHGLTMLFEHDLQGGRRLGAAFAFLNLGLDRLQHQFYSRRGLGAQLLALLRINSSSGGLGCGCDRRLNHFTSGTAHLVSPHRHFRQCCFFVAQRLHRLGECLLKTAPHRLQLLLRCLQLHRQLHVHTRPVRL